MKINKKSILQMSISLALATAMPISIVYAQEEEQRDDSMLEEAVSYTHLTLPTICSV